MNASRFPSPSPFLLHSFPQLHLRYQVYKLLHWNSEMGSHSKISCMNKHQLRTKDDGNCSHRFTAKVHVPIANLHCSSSVRAASRLAFHLQTGMSLHCFLPCQELFHYRHHSPGNCSQLSTLITWGYFATYGPLWSVLLIIVYNTDWELAF